MGRRCAQYGTVEAWLGAVRVRHTAAAPEDWRPECAEATNTRWALTPLGQALLDGLKALEGKKLDGA